MANKMHREKIRVIWAVILLAGLILFFLTGCGTKKTASQSEKKEKTGIELTGNSTVNTKVEQEKQYVSTNTKERIVTLYGLRVDTIYQDGEPVLVYTSHPLQKDEEREISMQGLIEIITRQDSVQNAIELKYENDLKEKDKRISEFKETRTLYHIALIVLGAGLILALIFTRRRTI